MATRAASCCTAGSRRSARRRGSRRWPARRSGGPEGGRVASKAEQVVLDVAGHEVSISNPSKVYFPEAGITKLDVVRYYLAVAEGALHGAGGRPNVLVRYADGIHGDFFYQKRAPASRPPWIEVVALRFPSGRMADEIVPRDAAALAWMANLGCLELHPHPVRAEDLDHPDELRIDLDPVPGVVWSQLQDVARVVREVLACAPQDFTLRTMPARFATAGDRHAAIDESPCSLEPLLALSAKQEAAGLGDAPWPPHYAKQADEPPRVQPSRRKAPTGRRTPTKPLIEIGRAAKKEAALAGLER